MCKLLLRICVSNVVCMCQGLVLGSAYFALLTTRDVPYRISDSRGGLRPAQISWCAPFLVMTLMQCLFRSSRTRSSAVSLPYDVFASSREPWWAPVEE